MLPLESVHKYMKINVFESKYHNSSNHYVKSKTRLYSFNV